MDALKDENSVVFKESQPAAFEAIRDAIYEDGGSELQPSQSSAGLNDLEQLAALRDKGILTEEEFTAKKRQILGL